MILVGQYDSPYVRRVAISLHLLELPFARNAISVFSDADAMRTINPLGRIPSLVLDDGEVLIDSAAILDHLDELAGPRALLPRSGKERRRALHTIALATGTQDKVGAIVYEQTLRPPEKRHTAWIERCRTQVDSGLAALEAAIAPLADRPTQPQITTACLIAYLHHRFEDPIKARAYPKLEQLWSACEALPAFRVTRPSEDEKMPDRPL